VTPFDPDVSRRAPPTVLLIDNAPDLGFVVLGIYLGYSSAGICAAIAKVLVAMTYFVVVKFVVMPHFGNWWYAEFYKELYPPCERSYCGIIKTILSNPGFLWKA
jgi:hypothetical protein